MAEEENKVVVETPEPKPEPETSDVLKRGHHRRDQGRDAWIVGVVFIVLGVVFMLQNTTGFYFENWWALFILIPAVSSLSKGVRQLQASGGKLTRQAGGSFVGALILSAVSMLLLFNLDWNFFGPILLIGAGAAILIYQFLPKS